MNSTTSQRLGWTSSPDGRGTIDIIWSCVLTLFLTCWSVLVINVPNPGSSAFQVIYRKIFLLGLCILAPEIIFQTALGQLLSARRSVGLFHEAGYPSWKIRHGFYANMGGFHLKSPNWKAFPIDAEQLHFLVTKGYVKYPQLNEDQIRDKNKMDGVLRLVTLIQTSWFIVDLIARGVQGLEITALELSTSAFVFQATVTTFCWLRKPADVQSPEYLYTDTDIAKILLEAGDDAARVYSRTPLDFASRHDWAWSIMWAHGLQILRRLHLGDLVPKEWPVQRFENTYVAPIKGWPYVLFVAVGIGYFAIFFAGWNFSFPTNIERTLWRAASAISLISCLSVALAMKFSFDWYPAIRRKLPVWLTGLKDEGSEKEGESTLPQTRKDIRHNTSNQKRRGCSYLL